MNGIDLTAAKTEHGKNELTLGEPCSIRQVNFHSSFCSIKIQISLTIRGQLGKVGPCLSAVSIAAFHCDDC